MSGNEIRRHASNWLRALSAATALALLVFSATAQDKNVQIRTAAPAYAHPASGSEMYANYCAQCHGVKGLGNGPAARAFKSPPPNLTLLAKRHGGKYPKMLVRSRLLQGTGVPAHGSVHMPTWSDALRHVDSAHQGTVHLRINNLTDYVETLQEK